MVSDTQHRVVQRTPAIAAVTNRAPYMFTGIVQAQGTVARVEPRGGDLSLLINAGQLDMQAVQTGDSIATNGVCLTVTEHNAQQFRADVSRETLAHTTLGSWTSGRRVNLEKALLLSSSLDGHLVSGHVDGCGTVLERRDDARSLRLRLAAPPELARYIACKGSICVDGVSLTVNAVVGHEFELNIVPHTARATIIQDYQPGVTVNLEVDVIARYLERLLQAGLVPAGGGHDATAGQGQVSMALLAEHGFLNHKR